MRTGRNNIAKMLLALSCLLAQGVSAADKAAPSFQLSRVDVAQTGLADFAPVTKPKVRWTASLPELLSHQTIQPVLSADGKTLYLSCGSRLIAIEADTGKTLKSEMLGAIGYPAVRDDPLYITGAKSLKAYSIGGGALTKRWEFTTAQPFNSESKYCSSNGGLVTPLKDLVLLGCGMTGLSGIGDTALRAVNAADGKEAWAFDPKQRISPSIAADETAGLAFLVTMGSLVPEGEKMKTQADGFLCAVELAAGKEKWRAEMGNAGMTNGPACADGVVYAGGNTDLVAVNAADGKELWRVKRKTPWRHGAFKTHLVLAPDRVVVHMGAVIEAYGRKDGALLWSQKMPNQSYCLLATREVLYAPMYDAAGAMTAMSLADGKTLWTHAAGDAKSQCKGVAIGEGRIYFGNYSGKLYCLENGE